MTSDLNILRKQQTGRRAVQASGPITQLERPHTPQFMVPYFEQETNMWEGMAKAAQNFGDMAAEYKKEQDARKLLEIETQVDEAAVRFRDNFAFQPEKFEKEWDKYSAQVLSQTNGEMLEQTRFMLDKKFTSNLSVIMSEKRNQDRSVANKDLNTKMDVLQNQMLAMAYNGEAGSEAYQELFKQVAAVHDTAVGFGFQTEAMKEAHLDTIADLSVVESTIAGAQRAWRGGGIEQAQGFLEDALRDPSLNLTPAQREGAIRRGLASVSHLEAKRNKAEAEAKADAVSRLSLNISRVGTPFEDMPEEAFYAVNTLYEEIDNADYLTPAQKSGYKQQLDNQMVQKVKKEEQMAKMIGVLAGDTFDRNNKDHQDAADFYFEQMITPVAAEDPQKFLSDTLAFVEKTQIVPDAAQSLVRGNLFTGDIQQQAVAADFIRNVQEIAPQAVRDFGEQAIEKADYMATMMGNGGSPEQAVQLYEQATKVNPEIKKMRMDLARTDKHIDKNVNFLNTMSDRFDFGTGLRNVTVPQEMKAQFDALQQRFFQNTGSYESSQASAWRMLSEIWGESEVGTGGQKKWVKYAPSKITNLPDDKVQEQLINDVKTLLPEIDGENVRLISDDVTAREYSARRVPSYQVWTIKDGVYAPLYDEKNPDKIIRFEPDAQLIDKDLKAAAQQSGRNAIKAAQDAEAVENRVKNSTIGGTSLDLTTKMVVAPISAELTNFLSFYNREYFGSDEGEE